MNQNLIPDLKKKNNNNNSEVTLEETKESK